MAKLTVSENQRTLMMEGKSFFWLADTCWSAFTNISEEDWESYLDKRAEQGFNVLQINALPQWDRCGSRLGIFPFHTEDGFRFDLSTLNQPYFDRAGRMIARAVEKGFVPAIVVMWCNYVPKTWAAAFQGDNVIPEERVEPIVKKILETFNPYDPVYIISGDTGWDDPETVARYELVTDLVEQYAPGAPKCYHIKGRYDVLPQSLAERADFYLYQSGHNAAAQAGVVTLAESFLSREPKKPVINSEPCYEQMGYSHMQYGRFRQPEVRSALWKSLLSGACAGITYGANGVWNWQKPDMPKNPIGGEGFLEGLPADRALELPGAWDYGWAKRLFEGHGWTLVEPCQQVLAKYETEIRAGRAGNQTLLYVPTNAPLVLNGSFEHCTVIDLETCDHCELTPQIREGQTLLPIHPYLEDVLMILE